jgi:hypothetical protein
MEGSPAGWYPDPSGKHERRHWAGQRWTDKVSDRGVAGTDPLQLVPAPPSTPVMTGAQPNESPIKRGWRRFRSVPIWVQVVSWVALVMIVLGLVGAITRKNDTSMTTIGIAAVSVIPDLTASHLKTTLEQKDYGCSGQQAHREYNPEGKLFKQYPSWTCTLDSDPYALTTFFGTVARQCDGTGVSPGCWDRVWGLASAS